MLGASRHGSDLHSTAGWARSFTLMSMMPSVVAITLGGWAVVSNMTFQAVAHRQLNTTTASQSLREDYIVETLRGRHLKRSPAL